MRSRLIYLGAVLALLMCALVFTGLDRQTPNNRYHQHLEEPREADLGPCQVCGGGEALCTHLPILRIETGGQKIPGSAILGEGVSIVGYETGAHGEEEILAAVSTVETAGVWRHAGDDPTLSAQAFIRYRGDTSRAFRKHSYLIKLVEEQDPLQNRDLPLLGMSADNEWVLHGPFLDKTLLRNYMWMNLSAQVMGDAPDVRFCELMVDGEYQGLYVLMETNTQGEGRISLTEYTPGDPVCSYIVRIGTKLNPLKTIEHFTFYTNRLENQSQAEVLYPTLPDQTQAVHDYIRADFSEIERMLYSAEMAGGDRAWKDVLDMNSFVNYYILQEFLGVSDAFTKSTYFYRDVRGKLQIGPVWDYNNVLDNFFRPIPVDEFILSQRGWYARLMMDEEFVETVIARYGELRREVLSDERLNAYIDQTIAWLGGAVERNYEVWGYTFDPNSDLLTQAEYRQPALESVEEILRTAGEDLSVADALMSQAVRELNPSSFEESVEWMRDYMIRRGAWLDAHMDSLRQYCAQSKNAAHDLN